jgi:hypothetical protein
MQVMQVRILILNISPLTSHYSLLFLHLHGILPKFTGAAITKLVPL